MPVDQRVQPGMVGGHGRILHLLHQLGQRFFEFGNPRFDLGQLLLTPLGLALDRLALGVGGDPRGLVVGNRHGPGRNRRLDPQA